MNAHRIEKVTNGWVAYDDYNSVIAVATTDEQLADILGINISPVPAYATNLVKLNLNPDFNFNYFWHEMKAGNKIEAIKAFREAFVAEHHDHASVGLKAAKDFVEDIMSKMECF